MRLKTVFFRPVGVGSNVCRSTVRTISGRPGQPQDLSHYDKGPETIPVPLNVKRLEAERMGRLEPLEQPLMMRPVPKNSSEFNNNRAEFRKSLGGLRKQFATLWQERLRREEAAAADVRAAARAAKEHGNIVRAEKRKAALAGEAMRYIESQKEKLARKAVSGQARAQQEGRLSHLRQRWLRALLKDSARWIPESRVDDLITPAAFQMKYAWHLTGWFEAKERKRALREEARRSKQAGVPLREVVLSKEETAGAYATDWESDEEAYSPAGKAADVDASLDESGRVREALAVARLSSWKDGRAFPEPNYDSMGLGLPAQGSAAAAAQPGHGGVGLLNLLTGVPPHIASPVDSVLEEYETWLEEEVVGNMSEEALRRMPRLMGGSISLDDGERAPENAYIAACVSSGAVEALFYALLRKRARLQRVGSAEGLASLENRWGSWIRDVETRVGGIFTRGNLQGTSDPDSVAAARSASEAAQDESAAQLIALLTRMADGANSQAAKSGAKVGAEAASASLAEDSGDVIDVRNLEAARSVTEAVTQAATEVPLPATAARTGTGSGENGSGGSGSKAQ